MITNTAAADPLWHALDELSGFHLLLPDVMTSAEQVDAQLTQSMDSYIDANRKSSAA